MHMAELHVVPDGRTWTVENEMGRIVSQNHRKKARAVAEMNNAANRGDRKFIHGRNGQIQKVRTHRG